MVSEWIDYYKNHSGKNYLVQKKYEYTENPTIQGMWHPFVNVEPEIATAKFPVVMFKYYIILSPQYVSMHYLLKSILKLHPTTLGGPWYFWWGIGIFGLKISQFSLKVFMPTSKCK